MWHKVSTVAENFRLPVDKVLAFASDHFNRTKFGIVDEHGYLEANTWHCNDFVKACKEHIGAQA